MTGIVDIDIGKLADDVVSGVEHYFPSQADKDAAKVAIIEKLRAPVDAANAAQLKISLAEAKSGSLFLDGWHAAIGWSGALVLLFNALAPQLSVWIGQPVALGNTADLTRILGYMLGLGGMGLTHSAVQSFAKRKGG